MSLFRSAFGLVNEIDLLGAGLPTEVGPVGGSGGRAGVPPRGTPDA